MSTTPKAAAAKSTVQTPVGMIRSWFYPIKAEPASTHPTYSDRIDMGHAVKGYMSITANTLEIPGDDTIQVALERFAAGQLDVETTMSDLEVNSQIFGHKYTDEDGEISSDTDSTVDGGYAFIEPILQKDKSVVYRATVLFKVTPIAASEKQEADTKKGSEMTPKMNTVSFKIGRDTLRAWRQRKDAASLSDAEAWIAKITNTGALA